MFEFSVALKYLIPRKKQLSVSLIALMSVGVISLVVWLVLVFLSVTEGIEKGWLEKLTKLNAPLRITPTQEYYSSYYYQIDALSSSSCYQVKNIANKALAPISDPYNPEEDEEIPFHFPPADRYTDGTLIDPVQQTYRILSNLQKKVKGLTFQDFEIGGALMRLQLLRSNKQPSLSQGNDSQSFLTQVAYVASFADRSPYAASLVLPPRANDLDHLFYLSSHLIGNTREDAPSYISTAPQKAPSSQLRSLAAYSQIKQLKTTHGFWKIPIPVLPQKASFQAAAYFRDGQLSHITLPSNGHPSTFQSDRIKYGQLNCDKDSMIFIPASGDPLVVSTTLPLIVEGDLLFQAELIANSLKMAKSQKEILFQITGSLQGYPLNGIIPWDGVEIAQADVQTTFSEQPPDVLPWLIHCNLRAIIPINTEKETGVLLAKGFQDSGVLIGDRGYLSYTTTTASSIQEQRLPIFVSGFYDPGVLSIGSKFILVPGPIAHTINSASSSFNLDKTQSNGIQVWFENLDDAEEIKLQLQTAFLQSGIDKYWKVSTFREYDFAKDLLEQFQSDKYLFTLVGMIILIVACSNIISLLVLLVNDKKRQIGILQAMGASSRSIALIFGTCGVSMGILSSLIGTAASLYTLHHIDSIVSLLSMVQGHDAFNAAFYGKSLPDQLSHHAVIFVLIATPIISLCAGLVPAIKACRLRPSAILRSE